MALATTKAAVWSCRIPTAKQLEVPAGVAMQVALEHHKDTVQAKCDADVALLRATYKQAYHAACVFHHSF